MIRTNKQVWREEVSEALGRSNALILARYAGMTVEELSNLRRELKKGNAEFRVVKNTIMEKAVQGQKEEGITKLLSGQVGVVYIYGDVAAAAKVVDNSSKSNEKFQILGGYMDSSLLSKNEIKQLADLPSKEVLLAKIIGSLVAPHRNLISVIQAVPRGLVQVLNAIKDQKA